MHAERKTISGPNDRKDTTVEAGELQRYRRLLLAKRDELATTRNEDGSPVLRAGGLRGDPADQAAAQTEADLNIRLHQTHVRLLRAIEEAMLRINRGTFGECEVCKKPISKARLEAVPWTRLCRECKEQE